MQLGFEEAWSGIRGKTVACPKCRSQRARHSRRRYEGLWYFLFRVRPMKCSDCGTYFPVGPNSPIWTVKGEVDDRHLPFRPTEMDGPLESPPDLSVADPDSWINSGWRGVSCPACKSTLVRPARSGIDPASRFNFGAREIYRCVSCNASFRRTNMGRLTLAALILGALIMGGSYVISALRSGPQTPKDSPTLRRNQLPKVSPPVFR